MMPTQAEKCSTFRALHVPGKPLVMPNPWDAGTARILAALDFKALATTSAGLAFALGVADQAGRLTREQALANARAIAAATPLPVSADLENLYGHAPADAAATIPLAAANGLAGCSIEDCSGDANNPIYEFDHAVARVAAAAAAVRALPFPFTLTARTENFLHGRKDLADTIRRLQAFEAAGADVLYAPGLPDIAAVSAVTAALSKPVNVLVSSSNAHWTVAELAAAGAARISVGGALARAALGAFVAGAREIAAHGTFHYGADAATEDEIVRLLEQRTT
ncbi:MAG: isocitrate lyase/phosphoenolpyruvate mutase family protein [Hyphomicrobiaceae bacterium]|nr:MAG: isocitrate lyase/phosphoenolpyruvate mutase family protein [Hyphomicrobiaceae bacterium]